jgi:hypothetical protein
MLWLFCSSQSSESEEEDGRQSTAAFHWIIAKELWGKQYHVGLLEKLLWESWESPEVLRTTIG